MVVLASGAQRRNFQFDDAVIYGNPSGTASEINKGDWVMASGHYVTAGTTADAYYLQSGLGIALGNNPTYDILGNVQIQTALPIGTRGIFRVSGISAVSGSALVGGWVMPGATGSGLQGSNTGQTGMAAQWMTAPVLNPSGFTGLGNSGVARIVNIVSIGSTAQWDIQIFPGQMMAVIGKGA